MLAEKYHYSPIRKKLVPCMAQRKCRLGGEHLTKTEYVELKVNEPNRRYDRDIYHARRRVTDPYALGVIYFPNETKNLNQQVLAGEITQAAYSAAITGKSAPQRYTDLEHVQRFFEHLKAVTIPEGTVIRSTNPKFNTQQGRYVESKRYAIKPLNICYGSQGIAGATRVQDQFHPVSITWIGKDGYFYNTEIDQRLIDYNAARAENSSNSEFYRNLEKLHPDAKLHAAMNRSLLYAYETEQRIRRHLTPEG